MLTKTEIFEIHNSIQDTLDGWRHTNPNHPHVSPTHISVAASGPEGNISVKGIVGDDGSVHLIFNDEWALAVASGIRDVLVISGRQVTGEHQPRPLSDYELMEIASDTDCPKCKRRTIQQRRIVLRFGQAWAVQVCDACGRLSVVRVQPEPHLEL
jgi:hypothetical protein